MEKHGDFFLDCVDKTIVTVTKGPYNLEAYNDYAKTYAQHVESMTHEWASLTVLISDSLMMKDVHTLYQKQLAWRVRNGLKRIVVVYLDNFCPIMTDSQVKGAVSIHEHVDYLSTNSLETGLDLLVQEGFLSASATVVKKLSDIEWHDLTRHC